MSYLAKADISTLPKPDISTLPLQGVRFSTLEKICERLECQPGDIIRYVPGSAQEGGEGTME